MNRKIAKSDKGRGTEPQGIPISDAGLNDFEKKVKKAAKENPKIKERLPLILRYLTMIREHIQKNDARRAIFTTSFLDHELYNSGFIKPFYLKLGAIKGGSAKKGTNGIKIAIEELLPEMKSRTPLYMWKHFRVKYKSEEESYEPGNAEFLIYFDADSEQLQEVRYFKNKKSEIKSVTPMRFKTFERYFYEVKSQQDLLKI